ncbi:MAG: hypothetical protein ACFFC7_05815 [Candidatus Hermodarchaeota archaeon]
MNTNIFSNDILDTQENTVYCYNCALENDIDTKFCKNCDVQIAEGKLEL